MSKRPLKDYKQPESISEIIGFAPPVTTYCAIAGSIFFEDDGDGGDGGDGCNVSGSVAGSICTTVGSPDNPCTTSGAINYPR